MRLPNFFLLGFELVAHPNTGVPWLIPSNLAPPADRPGSEPSADSDHDSGEVDVRASRTRTSTKRVPTPASPSSYALAKDFIFQRSTKEGRNTNNRWLRLLNVRMHQRYPLQGKEIKWPKNVIDLILWLLRVRVVRKLVYLVSRTEAGYVKSGREGLHPTALKSRVGCVLWLGPSSSSSAQDNDPPKDRRGNEDLPWDPITGPAPYTMMVIDGTPTQCVAVYNLPQLLGTDFVAKLRGKLGQYKNEEILMLKSKWAVVPAQMWLWKLQGFLSSPLEPGDKI